jgi:hypothetical protein
MLKRSCLVLAVSAACGGSDRSPPDSPPDASGSDGSIMITCSTTPVVSFRNDIVPLVGSCRGDGCHGALQLPSWPYQALINVQAIDCTDGRVIVKPGDPANSYLVQKLAGVQMCSGVRMPKVGTPLSDTSMKKIEDWICQGAPNN